MIAVFVEHHRLGVLFCTGTLSGDLVADVNTSINTSQIALFPNVSLSPPPGSRGHYSSLT